MFSKKVHGFETKTYIDIPNYAVISKIYYGTSSVTNFITEIPIESFLFAELMDTHFEGLASRCKGLQDRHPEVREQEDDAC